MQIKTFLQACKKLGHDPKKIIPDFSVFPKQHRAALIAYAQLIIIAEALNDGWKPNWNDYNEYKYYPWFYMNKPGFRFSDAAYDVTNAHSAGGSRLCFKSRALSDYAAKTFQKLFRDMMVLSK